MNITAYPACLCISAAGMCWAGRAALGYFGRVPGDAGQGWRVVAASAAGSGVGASPCLRVALGRCLQVLIRSVNIGAVLSHAASE